MQVAKKLVVVELAVRQIVQRDCLSLFALALAVVAAAAWQPIAVGVETRLVALPIAVVAVAAATAVGMHWHQNCYQSLSAVIASRSL